MAVAVRAAARVREAAAAALRAAACGRLAPVLAEQAAREVLAAWVLEAVQAEPVAGPQVLGVLVVALVATARVRAPGELAQVVFLEVAPAEQDLERRRV